MASANGKIREKVEFGTFKGVFLPSILTIFGVIMYLRLGWVLGNVGLVGTVVIVTIATAITFITGLSISSIATNMKVKGGGAYFMIARSMGVEAGAAIGISLYFAKAIGIAFYIYGFSESIHSLAPALPTAIIGIASLLAMTALAYVSANLALRASIVIFIAIATSLVSLFLGGVPEGGFQAASSQVMETAPFWMVFAIFFPAVTGIEAGLSMSGDLKNPARSLPLGTIAAVLVGYAVYLAIPIFLNSFVPKVVLLEDSMIVETVARVPALIMIGIWGATLSSALGSILGAPRTLQALAKDRVVPGILGKGHGPEENPRIATAISFMIAAAALLFGSLDSIAPVLSMFFLTTYGCLNLVCGLEGLIGNPSWRPLFRTKWYISLIGAALCLVAMFMINAGATFIAIAVVFLIYSLTARRHINPWWFDMRRSVYLALARFSVFKLTKYAEDVKTWRPNVLVLAGAPSKRMYLVELADAITHGKGFLTVASIIVSDEIPGDKIRDLEKSMSSYLAERNIPALVEVAVAEDILDGVRDLVNTYGIGPLIPNTVVLGETEVSENYLQFAGIVRTIYASKKNIVIVREGAADGCARSGPRNICCWWGGKQNNAGLMLAIGYMIQTSQKWRGSKLEIKTIVRSAEESDATRANLDEFLKQARLIARPDVLVHEYGVSPLPTTIREASKDADLVIIGMREPKEGESAEEYAKYYSRLIEMTKDFPPLAIVLAAEDIKFQEIFV